MGAYHTLDLELNRKFTLGKHEWDTVALERIGNNVLKYTTEMGHHSVVLFRWFKFTLKPPYSGASERSLLAIWDTSHWNFFVKFGLRTA